MTGTQTVNIKDMRRTHWPCVLKREYKSRHVTIGGLEGMESLLAILEVETPLVVRSVSSRMTIADAGYHWLQSALKGQYVWISGMFDPAGELVQVYMDITAGNDFSDPENPCFRDMYLDVVMEADGRFRVLDQEELDAALAAGYITKNEYVHASVVCARLCAWLEGHAQELLEYCRQVYLEFRNNS